LKARLFERGGASIVTPSASAVGAVAARTVIQADGDIVCFLDETEPSVEAAVERHLADVTDWLDHFAATITAAAGLLRRVSLALAAVVGAVVAIGLGRGWAVLVGVGLSLAAVVANHAERAVTWTAEQVRPAAARVAGGAARFVVLAAAVVLAAVTSVGGGHAWDIAVGIVLLVPSALVGWAVQFAVRRKLGFDVGSA